MSSNSQTFASGLYIVATPIGNLGDITGRALGVLQAADIIACEDTRTSSKLMAHFGIRTKLIAYHDHNEAEQTPALLEALRAGKIVALISDAGTPLISDPGYRIVHEAAAEGLKIFPIPGPSSVIAALCVSGLPTDNFYFAGFLPSKAGAREKAIAALAPLNTTLIVLESVHRLPESLAALALTLGARSAVIARELTKLHEEVRRGTLAELAAHYEAAGEPKGEVVIVIAPPLENAHVYDIDALLQQALQDSSVKEAASAVADITGLPRKTIYARALQLKL